MPCSGLSPHAMPLIALQCTFAAWCDLPRRIAMSCQLLHDMFCYFMLMLSYWDLLCHALLRHVMVCHVIACNVPACPHQSCELSCRCRYAAHHSVSTDYTCYSLISIASHIPPGRFIYTVCLVRIQLHMPPCTIFNVPLCVLGGPRRSLCASVMSLNGRSSGSGDGACASTMHLF